MFYERIAVLFFYALSLPLSLKGSGGFPGEGVVRSQSKQQQQQQQQGDDGSGGRRQENLRWAADLSFSEGTRYWQEQVSQLQKQLDFSTSMCQTLLQDQQVRGTGATTASSILYLIQDSTLYFLFFFMLCL